MYLDETKSRAICRQFTDKVIEEKRIEIESLFAGNLSLITTEGTLSDDEGEAYKRPQIFIDQLLKMPLMTKSAYNFTDLEISDQVFTMIIAVSLTFTSLYCNTYI